MQGTDALRHKLSSYLPEPQVKKILLAHKFAEKCHQGQFRHSGEPYITHPIAVATILADMRLDHESIMAALMHDVIEDTGATKRSISWRFGSKVAELVDGVSKLTEIEFTSKAEQQAENFQKMTMAMAKDIRVILVKLADRLHNMRTLGVLPSDKRRRIARETLEIYAPIAQRLGINDMRVEFEELGFATLYPLRHGRMQAAINSARGNRRELISQIQDSISNRLLEEGFKVKVDGREKHLWSIYQKMRDKHKSFRDIMDVFAFRIVTENVDDCYRVLGIMHNLFKPVLGEFKDYIAIPKSNGYQSLHTVLIGMHGVPIEVQIRTADMDAMANHGIAAHWLYKSKNPESPRARRWVQGLLDMQQKAGDPLEFIEHVKTDLFPDDVYVFTPQGEIINLPHNATPVDFAYAVHTGVGDHCIACRINGQIASLSQSLESGQRVEIITARGAQPNPNWLSFVITAKARAAIRHFLKNQKREDSIDLGKRLLDKALESINLTYSDIQKSWIKRLLKETKNDSFEGVLEQIGLGNQVAFVVVNLMLPPAERKKLSDSMPNASIKVDTSNTLVLNYARCCRPIPGDPILGYISPGKGVVVHRESCKNLAEVRHNAHKCTPVGWTENLKGEFPVEFKVHVQHQRGIIATLASRITDSDATIEKITIDEKDPYNSIVDLIIGVRDRNHLAEVLRKVRNLNQVQKAYRVKN